MQVSRQNLFESALLRVSGLRIRPTSTAIGELEAATMNIMALPVAGVFALHDAPRHHTVATPSHAVFISANRPYRLSFPGGVGDDCITVQFGSEALAAALPEAMKGDCFDATRFASSALLSADAVLARSLLGHCLWPSGEVTTEVDPLDIEERCLSLLATTLQLARRSDSRAHCTRVADVRPRIERVKEAIAFAPQLKWTLDSLARVASMSAFHLAHTFRAEVGAPVYQYVLRARLGAALERVLGGDDDLTAIALDSGFASHSHFTVRFREHFGLTPVALRRRGLASQMQLRKIVIAPQP